MPRFAWNHLIVLLFVLPLASCIGDEPSPCSTCPPDNSASLEVFAEPIRLPPDPRTLDTLRLDSIRVAVDGGSSVWIRSGRRVTFSGLTPGSHDVILERRFKHNGLVEPRTTRLQVRLEQGAKRIIVFHNDFPLISWSSPPRGRLDGPAPDGIGTHRLG